ncbi:hypothetical protein [Mycobacterium malmoense]|uniref:hypothetical protein n=1 Tax=Mycobacterium malmoense TaxID=1780 RepID=UPI0008F867C7|nr:hypothetical protein [Mycobacterium malmoense]OIN82809.1 hypothetical protein BMG05_00490 [Mycobacterium malmoense]
MKNADVRFYFDADILGLAHVICALRPDCTYPGDPGAVIKRKSRPPCVIQSDPGDNRWITTSTAQGWIGITRDSDIQTHFSLMQSVKDNCARLVTLAGPDAGDKWRQLETFMTQWRRIEALLDREGPLILSITRTSHREVDIEKCLRNIRQGRETRSEARQRRRDGHPDSPRLL